MTQKILKIEGMTCTHCAGSVAKALQSLNGVKKAIVDLKSKTATVEIDDEVTDTVLQFAIEDAGYELLNVIADTSKN